MKNYIPGANVTNSKVLFFSNTDWYLVNFRKDLIKSTQEHFNAETVAFVPEGSYESKLQELGMSVVKAKLDQSGINPVKDLLLILQCLNVFIKVSPSFVHLFTIKCVLYGGLCARLLGIPRVSAITGLGHLFICNSGKVRFLRWLLKPLFKFALGGKCVRVVFQNEEDRDAYVRLGLVDANVTELIRGSGVNLNEFPSLPLPENTTPVFLYIGRLLEEKGVKDLIQAADKLHGKRFNFELRLAGDLYPGNPSSLSEDEIKVHSQKPYLTFLGHVSKIREEIAKADVVILPSYREGTPKSLLEAAASSRAILCSDISGNRGVVVPDVNGYFFPAGDVDTMAEAMEMLASSPETIERYALASRAVVEESFSSEFVIAKTLSVYLKVLEDNVATQVVEPSSVMEHRTVRE